MKSSRKKAPRSSRTPESRRPSGARVGVKTFRSQISKFLKMAQSGQVVTITRGNEVMGCLVPPVDTSEDPWRNLTDAGLLTPPVNPERKAPRRMKLKAGISVADIVSKMRKESD